MHQVCETQSTSALTQQKDHEGVRRRRQTANCRTPKRMREKHYGGIRRLAYSAGMLGVGVFGAVCKAAAPGEPRLALLGFVVVFIISFVLVVNRLHNIGMNGWWSLVMLVPIAGVYVGIKCLACPEGYEDSKKLDAAGRLLTGISVGFMLLFTGGLILAIVLPQMHGLQPMPTSSLATGRDLSTPSSRLVGHWICKNSGAHLYYGSANPARVGIRGCYTKDTLEISNYKVLSEDTSGTRLVICEDPPQRDNGITWLPQNLDVSKDGLLMSTEDGWYWFAYRDAKTEP